MSTDYPGLVKFELTLTQPELTHLQGLDNGLFYHMCNDH